ncbi:hypothetical protein ACLKA7_001915 [Drosophila subpalustris]
MSTNTTTSDASSSPLLGQGLMQVMGDFLGAFKLTDVIKALFDLVTAKEMNVVALQVKKEHYAATCLEAFVTGLRGGLGTLVRGKEPETLQKAFEYATKKRDIFLRTKEYDTRNDQRGGNFSRNQGYRNDQHDRYDRQDRGGYSGGNQTRRFYNDDTQKRDCDRIGPYRSRTIAFKLDHQTGPEDQK